MKAQNKRASEFLAPSELILNPDQSVYHLKLRPEHLGQHVLVVGDQNRVEQISKHFDQIDFRIQNREFCTHTGNYNGQKITAISSGIGTDNIDIVINELDALVNVDLENRRVKEKTSSLNIVRIGTCGGLQESAAPGDFILSEYGLGLDGMLNYYDGLYDEDELALQAALIKHLELENFGIRPYIASSNSELAGKIGAGMHRGITVTANGFYAPQGRSIRLGVALDGFNDRLASFNQSGLRVMNYEMETSALYGLGASLGHRCATACVVIANRASKKALIDYKPKVEQLITTVLQRLTK